MTRHHVIISGTGRAGTTFLVQLLSELGLDTGYKDPGQHINENCRAGLEQDLRDPNAPYIVKSPWLCDYLEETLKSGDVIIDHALIPVRDLFAAAESRRFVVRSAGADAAPDSVNGGLWHTREPGDQESVLTIQLYKLIHALALYDIPVTLLYFPRLAKDPKYLYQKISFLLRKPGAAGFASRAWAIFGADKIDYSTFEEAFLKISRPDIIHSFSAK